ncbi:site-specific integrase [Rhodococcus globerulus]|uniref:tyrosine-type recombinase/integrase n=1 Tax=Rhodococcus globerulus TaxID=33008 RepID=UPI0030170803
MSTTNNRTRRAEPINRRVSTNGTVSYEFRLDVGARADGGRDRRRFTFATLAEARREFRRISTEVSTGRYVAGARTTVAEVAADWLDSRRDIRENTRRNYSDALLYVTRELGDLQIQALTQRHVDAWVTGLLANGGRDGRTLEPGTVRLALAVLKMVTKYAARQGIIARDPAEYVVSPKAKPTNRVTAQDIWTPREMIAFISFVKEEHRLWACYLLSAYGLRRSEVCGLRWSDVDLEAGTLSIEQGFVEVTGQHHVVGAPKTERSRRTLPLPEDLTEALRDLRARQRRESLAYGIGWEDDRHVCSNEDGTVVLPRTYSRQFAAMVKTAGLRPIILRNLRHTSVSVMLHDGVPPSTVAAWHGHDVRMSTAVYGRTYDAGLKIAAGALGRTAATG